MDAANIELRIPAFESGEKDMIDLFQRPNDPPYYGSVHLLNFHTVYWDIWERELAKVGFEKVGPHCKKEYRATNYQWSKNGGFCKQYGGQRDLTDATFRRCGAFDLIDARFEKLTGLNSECIRFAERNGYVETIPDKTVDPKRGYPLMCTRTNWGRVLPTVPLNYHVQGTAMWWMQKAMIRCYDYLSELNAEARSNGNGRGGYNMVMQVHDELVFDFPRGTGKEPHRTNLPKILQIKRLMEEGGDDIGIPTPVSIEYHVDNWSEGKTINA